MNLSRTVRLLLALTSGVALALAYPLYNLPLLGWFAPGLLIIAVVGERALFEGNTVRTTLPRGTDEDWSVVV